MIISAARGLMLLYVIASCEKNPNIFHLRLVYKSSRYSLGFKRMAFENSPNNTMKPTVLKELKSFLEWRLGFLRLHMSTQEALENGGLLE